MYQSTEEDESQAHLIYYVVKVIVYKLCSRNSQWLTDLHISASDLKHCVIN